jgi:hypothetical protein
MKKPVTGLFEISQTREKRYPLFAANYLQAPN